jgi:hypothetical protein
LFPATLAESVHELVVDVQPAFQVQVVGLLVHVAVIVMFVPTDGVMLLADSVHVGGCGVVTCHVMPTEYALPPVPNEFVAETM